MRSIAAIPARRRRVAGFSTDLATAQKTSRRMPKALPGKSANWPIAANGELVSALDGHWAEDDVISEEKVAKDRDQSCCQRRGTCAEDVQQATRDSIRAIMMVRAYRMRGHLHADLDPLGIAG